MTIVVHDILAEPWSEIELKDDIRVRFRTCLAFAFREGREGSLRTTTSVVASAPASFRGTPSGRTVDFASEPPRQVYHPSDWRTVRMMDCMYRLESGHLIRIRSVPTEIRRYASFGADGEPILQVISQTSIELIGEMEEGSRGASVKQEGLPKA